MLSKIRQFANYPKAGVMFQDISKLLLSSSHRKQLVTELCAPFTKEHIDVVAGLESRGLVLAGMMADRLDTGYLPIRKASGKLPGECVYQKYGTEYSQDEIKIGIDDIKPGQRVLIVDDLLATGGSAEAACLLVEGVGGIVAGVVVAIELVGLHGRAELGGRRFHSAFRFDVDTGTHIPDKDVRKTTSLAVNRDSTHANNYADVVFYHHSMEEMAHNYVAHHKGCRLGRVNWDRFPDGTPNIVFEHKNNLRRRRVIFFMSLRHTAQVLEQLMFAMVLPKQDILSLELIVPYFAMGTHERVNAEGVLASADVMAKLLTQGLPCTKDGPPVLTIVDIHALQERFYFSNKSSIHFVTALSLLKRHIHTWNVPVVFVMCDDGGAKRYAQMVKEEFPVMIFDKVRDGDQRKVTLKDQYLPSSDYAFLNADGSFPKGVHAVIIDDIANSGGTLVETGKELIRMGATDVSAFVVHAVFPNKAYVPFMKGGDKAIFKHFITTDTVPETTDILKSIGAPFVVLSAVPALFEGNAVSIAAYDRRVFVATKSNIKLRAVRDGCDDDKTVELVGGDYPSGVPEQPIGAFEAWFGAVNRLLSVKNKHPDAQRIHSMENSIICSNGHEDIGCVAYYSQETGRMTIKWTGRVAISRESFFNWSLVGMPKRELTYGKYMQQIGQFKSHDNWHAEVTDGKKDRVTLLADAIRTARESNSAYQV